MRLVFVGVAAVAALSLAACGKKEEKTGVSVSSGGVTVRGKDGAVVTSTNDGTVVIKGKDGQTVMASGPNAKAAMPSFAPLYPGATIESSIAGLTSEDKKADGGAVTYSVKATPQEIVAFYKEKAKAAGLTPKMETNMGSSAMYAAEGSSADKGFQVIASSGEGTTSVTLTWAEPR
jgi:hypothetical protein